MTTERNRETEERLSAGYAKCWYTSFEPLLPTSIIASVQMENKRREEDRMRAEQEKREALTVERAIESRDGRLTVMKHLLAMEWDAQADAAFIADFERPPQRSLPPQTFQVLRGQELVDAAARVRATRDGDNRQHEADQLEKIAARGAFRRVANPACAPEQWCRSVERQREAHPHMWAVTDFVASRVAASLLSLRPLSIPPIHLNGPPGNGKTHYTSDLAEALGAPIRIQSMDNAQASSLWLGTERHWGTAGCGIVFNEIVYGTYANPIFLIDEIDKAPRASQYDPVGPLHSLLEPLTACAVRDAGVETTFDASLAIYIATSNDSSKVPDTLRTRFREFVILPPRGEDALRVAHAVANRAIQKLGVAGFAAPERSLSHKLAHLTAREICQAVQDSAARAAQIGRLHLRVSDLPADVIGDESDAPGPMLH
ncbi:AAA family ATPase [Variovorax sp. J22P240]|uniref:AAA family ATPase n=1 Tax=Variovorax sp. J22P240 TaxID=3053514 RepID=UPI002576B37F|nr:AAA family ATPase [Variovorax sp. J22P240]MDM0001257.1 AAA family ATPase [Variovorax sp. J22P240]